MSQFDFDFSNRVKPYAFSLRAGLVGVALLVAGVLYLRHQHQTQTLATLGEKLVSQQSTTYKPSRKPQQTAQFPNIATAQQTLQTPWLALFNSIELAKQNNPHIVLMSITPQVAKSEAILVGEAKSFSEMSQFVESLKANPPIQDAMLQSQHLSNEETENNQYQFSLKLSWNTSSLEVDVQQGNSHE